MTTDQTDAERLADIRARVEGATGGPWGVDPDASRPRRVALVASDLSDAEFIAHARTDVPWLLDRLAEAEERAARLARWKAEAMPVIDGLQDLGRALDVPLGARCTGPEALSAVRDLQDRLAHAEARAVRAEGQVAAVEAVHAVPPSDDVEWLTEADYESCTRCNCAHCEDDDQWCPMAVLALVERKVEERDEQVYAALASDAKENGRG